MILPTLSIVMPHFNHGHYVEECARSLLTQSVSPLEFILIDDASTDGSLAALERVARDPRVRLLRHEKNRGVARTLEEGFAAAKGDYVLTAPADDVFLPGIIEKSLTMLAAHPQAGFSCGLAGVLSLDGRDLGPYSTPLPRPRAAYLSPEEFRAEFHRLGNWVVTYTAIYRREAALEIVRGAPDLHPGLDGLMIMGLGARYGACFIPERLTMWRRDDASAAGKLSRDPAVGKAYVDRLLGALSALGDLTPADLDGVRRRSYEDLLGKLAQDAAFNAAFARDLALALRGPGAWLTAYKAVMAAGGGRAATKLYLYPRRPVFEMLSIAARKLGLGR